jgi:hypothetical protein
MQLPRQRTAPAIEGFTPTATAPVGAELASPRVAPPGTYCRVGSDWAVKVVTADVDAETLIHHNNRFTPKPRPGYQYVMVEMSAKRLTAVEADPYVELEPRLYAEASDTVYDECLEVLPHPLVEAGQRGDSTGTVCFEVRSSDVHDGDLELLVQEAPSFDSRPKTFRLS